MSAEPEKLWGQQYPFERNQLQRGMVLTALGGVFAAAVIILVHAGVTVVLGILLVCTGVATAFAAESRRRYVQESRIGFDILSTRGGGFVFGSALAFGLVGVLVTVLILLE
jgi:hypothetical protein